MYRPVFYITAVYIAGLLSERTVYGLPVSYLLLCASRIIILALSLYYYRKGSKQESVLLLMLIIISLPVFSFGKAGAEKAASIHPAERILSEGSEQAEVLVRVCDVRSSKNGLKIKAELRSAGDIRLDGAYIMLYMSAYEHAVGDIISFDSPIYKYETAENDGEFDAYNYYKTRNVYGYSYPENIKLIKHNKSFKWALSELLRKIRSFAETNLKSSLDTDTEGVSIAMLVGEKGYIEEELRDSFADAGFSHILAISGLHISIIGMGLFELLKKSGRGLIFCAAVSMSALCLYALFTGGQVSCIRAVIMCSFALTAKCIGRKYDPYTALAAAAFIILIKQPMYIYDASFLLSFFAGFSVYTSAKLAEKPELLAGSKLKEKLLRAFIFSALMQIFMLPVQLCFFYVFCPYAVILNTLLLPLLGIVIGVSLILSLVGFLPVLALPLSYPVEAVVRFYRVCCDAVSKLPLGKVVCGKPGLIRIMLFGTILVIFIVAVTKTKRLWCFIIPLAACAVFIFPVRHEPEIYQLSIGQGDCGVIISGKNAVMIDCGSSDRDGIYEYTVQKFFNYHGFSGPDLIFVSHADSDHVNGIMEMIADNDSRRSKKVRICIPELHDEEAFSELIAGVEASEGYELVRLREGTEIELGNQKYYVLFPDRAHSDISVNENSMVLYLLMNDIKALYTGDISAGEEDYIIKAIDRYGLDRNIDILKTAHHGSRFSTSEIFLEKLNPDIALISCGKNNSYGHPSPETIKRLKAVGCESFVTAEQGMIKVTEALIKSNKP